MATTPDTSRSSAVVAVEALAWLTAVLVLVQGTLAGSFLGGDGGALAGHRSIGTYVLGTLSVIVIAASFLTARHRRWMVPASVVGFLGIGTQIGTGFGDTLLVHVPLGVALFGLYLAMAILLRTNTAG